MSNVLSQETAFWLRTAAAVKMRREVFLSDKFMKFAHDEVVWSRIL